MIRRLRRRHRWMVLAVAIVTAVVLGLALSQRAPLPIDQARPELTEGDR